MTVPGQLLTVAEKVDARVVAVIDDQRNRWNEVDPRLAELVEELGRMVASGGKRLRSAFVYWAWHGCCLDEDEQQQDEAATIDAGAAFEFLQTFALIHDDIMDDSAYRRGTTTVHVANGQRLTDNGWSGEPRRYGEGVAILVGDLGHVLADQLMAGRGERVRRLWDDLRIELNLGQYLDLRAAAAGEFDRETAQRVVTFKTALYTVVRPLQLGACLSRSAGTAGAWSDAHYHDVLQRFGLTGDNGLIGKPVGDDLREGKPTEMLIHAVEQASPAQRLVLDQIGARDLTPEQAERIVAVFHETGAVAVNENRIEQLLAESKAALSDLPLHTEAKTALEALADYVVARDR